MRVLVVLVCATWAAGCGHPTIDYVVVGAAPGVEAFVRDAVATFEQQVGPGRLNLRKVRFTDLDDGTLGQYHAGTILLDTSLTIGPGLERVVRHELCHALDFQEGLVRGAGASTQAALAALAVDVDLYESDVPQQLIDHEVLALTCESGPQAAQLASAVPCPDDATALNDVAAWTLGQVWSGDWEPLPVGSNSALDEVAYGVAPFTSYSIVPTQDPATIQIEWSVPEGSRTVLIDLYTGLPSNVVSEPASTSVGSVPAPTGLWTWSEASDDAGASAAIVSIKVGGTASAGRLVATPSADGPWSLVAGACYAEPLQGAQVFAADGVLWHSYLRDAYGSLSSGWTGEPREIVWQAVSLR